MTKILLADHHITDRESLAALLSEEGFEVIPAADGREAIERYKLEKPALVIIDLEVPIPDGHEVVSEIRQGQSCYIPIIFTSSLHQDKRNKSRALKMGGDDCLAKPVDREELLCRISSSLRLKYLTDELFNTREAHKKSEEKYRTLVEATDTGFAILDTEYRVIDANCEFVRMAGHLILKEVIGRSFFDWIADHDRQRAVTEFKQSEKGGYIRNMEIDFLGREGEFLPVEINATVLIREQGVHVMMLCRDIHQRMKIRRSLAERAMLGELGADISEALTAGETLRQMLQHCSELLVKHPRAALARIWVFDSAKNLLELQASAGLNERIDGPYGQIPIGKHEIGWIAQERRPYLTNHVIGDPRVHDQEWARREEIVSFAGYPLIVEQRLVGVLGLFAQKALTEFTYRSLASVANKVALGIERKKAARALRDSEYAFRRIFDNAVDGIHVVNAKNMKTEICNPSLCRMLGFSQEEMQHLGVLDIHPREELSHVLEQFEKITQNKLTRIEGIPVKRKDGSIFYADIDASPITLAGKACVMGIFRDVSDRMIMEEKLRSTSMTDMLTGVLNRRGFFTLAQKQWKMADRSKKAMSLFYMDLDGLKQINDDFGHSAGDLALIDTAKILKESFRESDIIARIGGDEFAVLITEITESHIIETLSGHLYEKIETHNKEEKRVYQLSISMGAVNYDPRHPRSINDLMSEADTLMYEDKRRKFRGKSRDSSQS